MTRLFGNTHDDNLKIQVSKAMLGKALSLEELSAIEQVRKFGVYRSIKITEQEILVAYSNLINKFRDSAIPKIQEDVACALYQKGAVLENMGQNNEALGVYNDLIDKYKTNRKSTISLLVNGAMVSKIVLLMQQAAQKQVADIFEQVVDACSELIDTFKDYKKTAPGMKTFSILSHRQWTSRQLYWQSWICPRRRLICLLR